MKILFAILCAIGAYFLGVFALSQIVIPVFNALPRALRLRRYGSLFKIIVTPVIWTIGLWLLYKYIYPRVSDYSVAIVIGLLIGSVQIILKSFRGGEDLDADLREAYSLSNEGMTRPQKLFLLNSLFYMAAIDGNFTESEFLYIKERMADLGLKDRDLKYVRNNYKTVRTAIPNDYLNKAEFLCRVLEMLLIERNYVDHQIKHINELCQAMGCSFPKIKEFIDEQRSKDATSTLEIISAVNDSFLSRD